MYKNDNIIKNKLPTCWHRGDEKKILVKPEDFQTYLDMGYQFNNPKNIKVGY